MLLVSVPIVLERAKSSIFYRTGIFGNFFFGGGGNFAFSKREFPVALMWPQFVNRD